MKVYLLRKADSRGVFKDRVYLIDVMMLKIKLITENLSDELVSAMENVSGVLAESIGPKVDANACPDIDRYNDQEEFQGGKKRRLL